VTLSVELPVAVSTPLRYQRNDAPATGVEAVRVTLPPAQKVVGPLGVIVGAGVELAVTGDAADIALPQPPAVTCTV